ncbi:MAG: endonuclease/exonuclease/phosphatase family protein [Chloroflexi bacterium]|nr:endonuclease/exonuclease/phosphatase family protein [Chloroflexota bacterium]
MSNNHLKIKRWTKTGFFLVLVMALMQACGTSKIPEGARIIEDTPTRNIPTKTPYVTATIPSDSILTATAAALQTHEGAVRFMSYNIQDGGQERLAQVLSVMQAYNADVLAVQEANGWGADDFAITKQAASDLGMEYIYCQADDASVDKNGNTYDLVLFSKLQIKSSEIYSNVANCLVRAEVITAGGQSVQVFATHIRPNFDEVGCKNVENIAKAVESFVGGPAILMGDMTMPPPEVLIGSPASQIACPPIFTAVGLSFFSDVSQVDHVWVTQAMLDVPSYKLPRPSNEPLVAKNILRNASDHQPLAVDFYFP